MTVEYRHAVEGEGRSKGSKADVVVRTIAAVKVLREINYSCRSAVSERSESDRVD